jgi:hypothetical protein
MESGLSIRDGCLCHDIEKACDQLAVFATGFTALPDMCDMFGECCINNGTTTTNVDWDFCMAEAQEVGNFTLPDFAVLVPGGLPVFNDDYQHKNESAGSSSNYAAKTALAFIGSSLIYLFV